MRALLTKYLGASLLGARLVDLWRLALIVPLVLLEILAATALFDFYLPSDFPIWKNPALYTNALGKVALVAVVLFALVAWQRREEIEARYTAVGTEGLRAALVLNFALFAALLVCRYLLATSEQPSLGLLLSYAGVVAATAASMALALAPPAFWRRLLELAPVEIVVALVGAVVVVAAGTLAQGGWDSLSGPTLALSHWFLGLYEQNIFLDVENRVLGVGSFQVQVFGACSGYEGVALLAALLSAYIWVFRRELRFPNVLLLLPIGIAVVWTLNALRIAVLVSIGAHVSPTVAVQGFHSAAGWIFFLLVMLGCVAASRRIPFFAAAVDDRPHDGTDASPPRASLVFLAPFIALVSTSIVASAFAPHDQWLYVLKIVGIGSVLWWFRGSYLPYLSGASLSSVLIGLAVGVAWIVTDPNKGTEAALGVWLASLPIWLAAIWLALRAVGSVVLVPIAEELAFRGYLARVLVARDFESVGFGDFRWLAFLGSSLAFGLVHQRWAAAFLAGAIYALLMYRTKKLSDPIAAHAASNATLMFWAIVAQQWSLL